MRIVQSHVDVGVPRKGLFSLHWDHKSSEKQEVSKDEKFDEDLSVYGAPPALTEVLPASLACCFSRLMMTFKHKHETEARDQYLNSGL